MLLPLIWRSTTPLCMNYIQETILSILLVLTLALRGLRHWPSIAGMSPQNHCGDEEDGCIGLSSWHCYICIMLFAFCMLITLCVMNQFFLINMHERYIYIDMPSFDPIFNISYTFFKFQKTLKNNCLIDRKKELKPLRSQ